MYAYIISQKEKCSLVISHMPCTCVPIAVTLNLWIIPSNPETLGSTMAIICPDKATSTVPLQQSFSILRLSPACSATFNYFHLLPHYEDHSMVKNVFLDTTNINVINISTLDLRIWQHFNRNWTQPHLQKLANVPEVPVGQLYRDIINASEPIHSFSIKDNAEDSLIWAILKHPGTYIGTLIHFFSVCIGVYCFKRFWIRPVTHRHQPFP